MHLSFPSAPADAAAGLIPGVANASPAAGSSEPIHTGGFDRLLETATKPAATPPNGTGSAPAANNASAITIPAHVLRGSLSRTDDATEQGGDAGTDLSPDAGQSGTQDTPQTRTAITATNATGTVAPTASPDPVAVVVPAFDGAGSSNPANLGQPAKSRRDGEGTATSGRTGKAGSSRNEKAPANVSGLVDTSNTASAVAGMMAQPVATVGDQGSSNADTSADNGDDASDAVDGTAPTQPALSTVPTACALGTAVVLDPSSLPGADIPTPPPHEVIEQGVAKSAEVAQTLAANGPANTPNPGATSARRSLDARQSNASGTARTAAVASDARPQSRAVGAKDGKTTAAENADAVTPEDVEDAAFSLGASELQTPASPSERGSPAMRALRGSTEVVTSQATNSEAATDSAADPITRVTDQPASAETPFATSAGDVENLPTSRPAWSLAMLAGAQRDAATGETAQAMMLANGGVTTSARTLRQTLSTTGIETASATTGTDQAPSTATAESFSVVDPTTVGAPTKSADQQAAASTSTASAATANTATQPDAATVEKIAANGSSTGSEKESGKTAIAKSSVRTDDKRVARYAASIGIGSAKTAAMSSSATLERPLSASFEVNASAAASDARVDSAALPPEVALASSAHRAVETALNVADRFSSRNQHSVDLQFSVGGNDLNVRVEMRGGEVQTTFRTDSSDLRTALASEWQAVKSQNEGDRGVRLADPVFATAQDSSSSSTGDGAERERQQEATLRGDVVPASLRSRPTSTPGAAAPTTIASPASRGNSLHLSTLA